MPRRLIPTIPRTGSAPWSSWAAHLWWRAAIANENEWRGTAIRYGLGLVVLQILWVSAAILFDLPILYGVLAFIMLGELMLPRLAEGNKPPPWHRHHIVERYNLLNIIVLGEMPFRPPITAGTLSGRLSGWRSSGLIIVCALWWLYFAENDKALQMGKRLTFVWAYGHIILFAAGAAVGAGLAVMVEVLEHKAHISAQLGTASVAIPAGLYLLGLWFIHPRFDTEQRFILPLAAVLLFATPLLPFGIYPVAAILVLAIVAKSRLGKPAMQEG